MRLILLGPPGSGKGTQAERLSERLQVEHIGTGDLLREAIRTETPVGKQAAPFVHEGKLVPDELVNDLIAEHFRAKKPARFVMDGYPRTVAQAMAFDALLKGLGLDLTVVLLLQVPDEAILRRLAGRWSCPKPGCKATYHTETKPPRFPGFCDRDGVALIQRDDDKKETVRNRLVVYHHNIEPLAAYYQSRGLLHEVPGQGGMEEVYNNVTKALRP